MKTIIGIGITGVILSVVIAIILFYLAQLITNSCKGSLVVGTAGINCILTKE